MLIASTRPTARRLPAAAAATGSLDRDHVARAEADRDLGRQRPTVHEIASGLAVATTLRAVWRTRAALAEDRQAGLLEDAQLAHDAVSTSMRTVAAASESQRVPLDA